MARDRAGQDRRSFWEDRLDGDWTETGVGYGALGTAFNTAMYRVRREVFLREAGRLDLDWPHARILDIGSGTGFYVALWQQLGAQSVTGSDLTQAAVDRLRDRFRDAQFLRLDIGDAEDVLTDGVYDAVSCIDVLFHITDDERYASALQSIGRAVRPGGYALLSENFVHRGVERGPNQVNRPKEWTTELLDRAGLDIVRRTPMLFLMNAQVDSPRLWRKAWGGVLRAATLTEPTGRLDAAALTPLERRLVRSRSESPTTELVICRRR